MLTGTVLRGPNLLGRDKAGREAVIVIVIVIVTIIVTATARLTDPGDIVIVVVIVLKGSYYQCYY